MGTEDHLNTHTEHSHNHMEPNHNMKTVWGHTHKNIKRYQDIILELKDLRMGGQIIRSLNNSKEDKDNRCMDTNKQLVRRAHNNSISTHHSIAQTAIIQLNLI